VVVASVAAVMCFAWRLLAMRHGWPPRPRDVE
jgi:hypothetical protein